MACNLFGHCQVFCQKPQFEANTIITSPLELEGRKKYVILLFFFKSRSSLGKAQPEVEYYHGGKPNITIVLFSIFVFHGELLLKGYRIKHFHFEKK